MNNTLKVLKKQ